MTGPMQNLLDALPADGGCRTVADLSDSTGVPVKKVSEYLCRMRTAGLVARPKPGCYRLSKSGVEARDAGKPITSGPNGPLTGRKPPNRNSFRARLWRALRAKKKATVPELIATAGAGDLRDPASAAHHYLGRLVKGGYVVKTQLREPGTAPTSPGFARYLLLKDTGPEAPVYSYRKGQPPHIFDPNTNETVPLDKAGGAAGGGP